MTTTATQIIKIRKSEDKTIRVALESDGLPVDVSSCTIKAQLMTISESPTENGAELTLDSGATGADWSAGVLVVTWTDTQTAAMTVGTYQLEVDVETAGGVTTKYVPDEKIQVLGSVI